MATLTVQTVVDEGLEATYASAASGGDEFAMPDGALYVIHAVNGATECNLTVVTAQTVEGLAVADQVVTVTANEERFIGPLTASLYRNSSGNVQMTYDDESNVTIAVLKIG